MSKEMNKEVNPKMFEEFAKVIATMTSDIISIADKYGQDRNHAIEKCAETFMLAATLGDYSEYFEAEGDNENE